MRADAREEALAAIRAAARKLGHAPKQAELAREGGPGQKTLARLFGSYADAIEAAGFPRPGPDLCVVKTAPLSAVLKEWVDQWEKRRLKPLPVDPHSHERPPIAALVLRTRELGQPVSGKTIRRVLEERSPTTELRVADPLLTAIRRPDVLGTAVPVEPNPLVASGVPRFERVPGEPSPVIASGCYCAPCPMPARSNGRNGAATAKRQGRATG